MIAAFPVYRSYIADDGVHDADRRYIEIAVRRATARNPLLSRRVFRFIREMLLLESPELFTEEDRASSAVRRQVPAGDGAGDGQGGRGYVVLHLQPAGLAQRGRRRAGEFGLKPEAVHAYNRDRQARWPYALSPLSTHDTKRSEDVRRRINVLSEIAGDWWAAVERWSRFNEPHRGTKADDDQPIPDANEEYLLYQTLVGAWPLESDRSQDHATFVGRVQEYMLKACTRPRSTELDRPERRVRRGRRRLRRPVPRRGHRVFLDDFRGFQRGSPATACQLAVADAAEAGVAGRPRHVPGDRAVGLQPGGPGQPPAG